LRYLLEDLLAGLVDANVVVLVSLLVGNDELGDRFARHSVHALFYLNLGIYVVVLVEPTHPQSPPSAVRMQPPAECAHIQARDDFGTLAQRGQDELVVDDHWVAFGKRLLELRGQRSLRNIERAVPGISRSELSRVERGVKVPSSEMLDRLGDFYGVDPQLVLERDRLLGGTWRPSKSNAQRLRTRWVYTFPAGYSGEVWLRVLPSKKEIAQPHRIVIRWGPWEKIIARGIPATGAIFSFSKGNDGLSIPIVAQVVPHATLIFGTGTPVQKRFVDLNRGWTFKGD
jgi:hypothetical protein